jgi:hypothetical protein
MCSYGTARAWEINPVGAFERPTLNDKRPCGTASTFSIGTERAEINKIEKLLNVRLTRRNVAPHVAR